MFGRLHISKFNKVVCSSFEEEERLKSDIKAQIFLWVKHFFYPCLTFSLLFRVTCLAAALFDVNVAVHYPRLFFPSATPHGHLFVDGFHFFTAEARLQHCAFLHRVPVNKDNSKITPPSTVFDSKWVVCAACLRNSLRRGHSTGSAAGCEHHWLHCLAMASFQIDGLLVHHTVLARSAWCGGEGAPRSVTSPCRWKQVHYNHLLV